MPPVVQMPPRDDSSDRADKNGFVSLFNGKDLNGWQGQPGLPNLWCVQENAIAWPRPGYVKGGVLRTARSDYGDFHLSLEARISKTCYAQLAVRFNAAIKSLKDSAYKIVLNNDGNPYQTGSLLAGSPQRNTQVRKPLVGPDQWFLVEVLCQDNRIQVKINGQTTADYVDPERRFTRGHIAFVPVVNQISFRNIKIKELKATPGIPPVAPRNGPRKRVPRQRSGLPHRPSSRDPSGEWQTTR